MNKSKAFNITPSKRLMGIVLFVPILLLIPFIAMFFTDEVMWTLSDFVIGAILLLTAGVALEVILSTVKVFKARVALCIALLFVFVLIWGELAVGLFGTPLAGS